MAVSLSLLPSFEHYGNGKHMDPKEDTQGNEAKSSSGWARWKKEMRDNRLGFLIVAIWMAMGIPVIYVATMFR